MTSTNPVATAALTTEAVAEPVPAEGRRLGRGHITSYEAGRTCSTSGCGTLLSRYNAKGACALHSLQVGGPLSI